MFDFDFNVQIKRFSYNNVMRIFTAAFKGLEKVIDENSKMIGQNAEQITKLNIRNGQLSDEMYKAERMKRKLGEFLS